MNKTKIIPRPEDKDFINIFIKRRYGELDLNMFNDPEMTMQALGNMVICILKQESKDEHFWIVFSVSALGIAKLAEHEIKQLKTAMELTIDCTIRQVKEVFSGLRAHQIDFYSRVENGDDDISFLVAQLMTKTEYEAYELEKAKEKLKEMGVE